MDGGNEDNDWSVLVEFQLMNSLMVTNDVCTSLFSQKTVINLYQGFRHDCIKKLFHWINDTRTDPCFEHVTSHRGLIACVTSVKVLRQEMMSRTLATLLQLHP